MMRFDFREGSGIAIGAEYYRFVERMRDASRSPVFRHVGTDEPKAFSDRELRTLIMDSHVKFLTPAEVSAVETTGEPPKGPTHVFLDDIKSECERARAEKYEKYLWGWHRAGRPALSDIKLAPVVATVAREQGDADPPSTRTLRRIIPEWVARGCTLGGVLTRRNHCGAKSQVASAVREIILDVIWDEYLTLERPAVTDCYESVKAKIDAENAKLLPGTPKLRKPSVQQLYREIDKIDKFTVKALREGSRAAMLAFAPRYAGVEVTRHNQRWELDSTVVDLMLIDHRSGRGIGRPTITIIIDCYTRTIVGFYIGWEGESFVTFVSALKHALQPKDDTLALYPEIRQDWASLGPPEYIAVDNHTAYTSDDCRTSCQALGIDLQYTPVLKPWYRPIVERFFNTLTHKIFQRVPGTTFSNIFERNGEVAPETIAVATLDELRMIVTKWIVDEYHYTRHRGIKTAPAALLEESMRLHATVPPPSLERMKTALALVVERIPQHYGIEWEGMLFNSAAVANLMIAPGRHDRKVRIAVDHDDVSSLMMHDPVREEWISVPRVKPQSVAGEKVSFGQHCLIRQLLKDRTDEFLDPDSYRAAHDFVARYVETKRVAPSTSERRKAARFQFPERAANPKTTPTLDEMGSQKAITDDIFDGAADAKAPQGNRWPRKVVVDEDGVILSDEVIPSEQGSGEAPKTTEPVEGSQGGPAPAPDPERSSSSTPTSSSNGTAFPNPTSSPPVVFVPSDEDVDLDAAAATLGFSTHKE